METFAASFETSCQLVLTLYSTAFRATTLSGLKILCHSRRCKCRARLQVQLRELGRRERAMRGEGLVAKAQPHHHSQPASKQAPGHDERTKGRRESPTTEGVDDATQGGRGWLRLAAHEGRTDDTPPKAGRAGLGQLARPALASLPGRDGRRTDAAVAPTAPLYEAARSPGRRPPTPRSGDRCGRSKLPK
jgi:hypothetical protein